MKRFFSPRRIASALIALAVLGLVLPASAGDQVPFKGSADEVVTAIEPAEDGLHLTVAVTGVATHLGRFTREEHLVLHLEDGTFDGTLTFIAANGDELCAVVEGGFISATTAVATYTFTGGTGRFANATGWADVMAVTSDGIHATLTFEGTIAF